MRRKLAAVLLPFLASGCLTEWHRSPLPSLDDLIAAVPWFSVMHRGLAIQPYKYPRQPVAGTVPVTGADVVLRPIPGNRDALAALANPVERTAASLERGRDRYQIYCAVCHGDGGLGDGPVAASLANAVRNLTTPTMRDLSDGWLYAVTVHGFGALMPEYGSKIRGDDRWHVVNYVRVLQGAAQ